MEVFLEVTFEDNNSAYKYFDFKLDILSEFIKNYCKLFDFHYDEILINYNIVTEKTQIQVNKEFLNHDYNTDIITFDLSSDINIIEGDIYINCEQVSINAIEFNTSFESEFHRVLIHGFFHLLGYNDKSEEEEIKMRELEDSYLFCVL